MNREPLITVASITAAVTAVLGLLVAFGFDLTGEQQTAILGVAAVAAPLIVAGIGRSKVTPTPTVPASPAHRDELGFFRLLSSTPPVVSNTISNGTGKARVRIRDDEQGNATLYTIVLALAAVALVLWLLDALRVINLG